jgi:very-short-patch-repair endonuclease
MLNSDKGVKEYDATRNMKVEAAGYIILHFKT